MEERKEEGFTVRDRRIFSQEGKAREEAPEKEEKDKTSAQEKGNQAEQASAALPPLDFSSFILSLAASAHVSLGVIPNPETKLPAKNLQAAKQMIDIIAMLKEKTKGNLSPDEAAMIEDTLYSLRMLYIKSVEAGA